MTVQLSFGAATPLGAMAAESNRYINEVHHEALRAFQGSGLIPKVRYLEDYAARAYSNMALSAKRAHQLATFGLRSQDAYATHPGPLRWADASAVHSLVLVFSHTVLKISADIVPSDLYPPDLTTTVLVTLTGYPFRLTWKRGGKGFDLTTARAPLTLANVLAELQASQDPRVAPVPAVKRTTTTFERVEEPPPAYSEGELVDNSGLPQLDSQLSHYRKLLNAALAELASPSPPASTQHAEFQWQPLSVPFASVQVLRERDSTRLPPFHLALLGLNGTDWLLWLLTRDAHTEVLLTRGASPSRLVLAFTADTPDWLQALSELTTRLDIPGCAKL